MTWDQEEVVSAHGWTSLLVLILSLLTVVAAMLRTARRIVCGVYRPRGKDQNIPFSDVPGIECYVPEVKSPLFAYPLIMCNIDEMDSVLLNWDVMNKHCSHYVITNDVAEILGHTNCPDVFAKVKYWPRVQKTNPGAPNKVNSTFCNEIWYNCLDLEITDEVFV
jgi:hypothetical protein